MNRNAAASGFDLDGLDLYCWMHFGVRRGTHDSGKDPALLYLPQQLLGCLAPHGIRHGVDKPSLSIAAGSSSASTWSAPRVAASFSCDFLTPAITFAPAFFAVHTADRLHFQPLRSLIRSAQPEFLYLA